MYVGLLKKYVDTENAIVITAEGLDLLGRADRKIFLPKSQVKLNVDPLHGTTIEIPDWLIIKNHVPWFRITEIEPISPDRKWRT